MSLPLYPCHTIAYDTSVCQRMNKISHTLAHADKRYMNVRHRLYTFKERPRTAAYAGIRWHTLRQKFIFEHAQKFCAYASVWFIR